MPKKSAPKRAPRTAARSKKPATITKDGLFIPRKMRRDAEAAARDEAERLRIEQDDYQDSQDRIAYDADPANQAKTDTEKAYDAERAQAQATADARKKFGLK